jgi:hypothetical protein
MPLSIAEGIVGYFCETGRIGDDSHWRDMNSLNWNLYAGEQPAAGSTGEP